MKTSTKIAPVAHQDTLRGLLEKKIERPPCIVEHQPDTEFRDTEKIPLLEEGGIEAVLRQEVFTQVPDGSYDTKSVTVGYAISLTRYIYESQPLRSLEEIQADILALEKETGGILGEVIGGGRA